MTATYKSDWDLSKFPFDSQVLTGSINLVDNIAYASDRPRELPVTVTLDFYGASVSSAGTLTREGAAVGGQRRNADSNPRWFDSA